MNQNAICMIATKMKKLALRRFVRVNITVFLGF